MSITKQCTKCGEVKALDAFIADKRRKDGKTSSCKDCARKYRQKNKEKQIEYYQKHRVHLLAQTRKYYEENKCKKLEYASQYHKKHKERRNEYFRKYQQENPEAHRRAMRKRRALLRNLPHQPLTPQQYDILHRQKYEIFGGIASGN